MEIFSIAFVAMIGATIIFMFANMAGGVLISKKEDDFNKYVLVESIITYLFIVAMGVMLYFGFSLIANGLEWGLGVNVPIQEIITLGLIKYAYYYGEQALNKWNELVLVRFEEGEE